MLELFPKSSTASPMQTVRVLLGRFLFVSMLLSSPTLISPGELQAQSRVFTQREQIRSEYAELHRAFSQQLHMLADQCDAQGLTDEGRHIRRLAIPFAEQTLDVDNLPEQQLAPLAPTLPAAELAWRSKLRKTQVDYANSLFLLSRRALQSELITETYQYLREAAFQDPNHEQARKSLGYVLHEGRWVSPYALLKLRQGEQWHEKYGWINQRDLARFDRGERPYRTGWVSAEKEAALRTNFDNAWVIQSEHFSLKTNTSRERGVQLVTDLEDFHRFFMREFPLLFNTRQQAQSLFSNSTNVRPKSRPHQVYYYRQKGEYVKALARKQSGVEQSNGIYMPDDRIAYFFENPDDPEISRETMFHEVTHQLLSESSLQTFPIADERDFWIVEGFACYMESFSRHEGRLTVGSPHHMRVYSAKHRIVGENWLIPFDKLMSYGRREFQLGAEDFTTLQKMYSQSTGMAHFFMHYDDGLYRDSLLLYLGQLYSPDKRIRNAPQTLSEITGVSSEKLQEQYVSYMKALDSQPILNDPTPTLRIAPAETP
ncbi:MAG: hypothetical protein R3C01_00115 [Planctomycetaceae bacterium]